MSTRSKIAIVVKDGDLGRTFNANPELLHAMLCVTENPNPEAELHSTKVEHKVLSIYHHWDGYPDGVGNTLLSHYNSYDKVLNLMLFGDASTINDEKSIVFYNSWRGEKREPWESVKPNQLDDIPSLVRTFNSSDQEYLYIYIPDNEGNYNWYFIEQYGEDKGILKNLDAEINGTPAAADAPVLEGNTVVTRTEAKVEIVDKMYVLICQIGNSISVEAVSSDEEKLKKVLKEKVLESLKDRFGAEDELDPDCDEYELDLYKSAKELDAKYWSDGDDECPVEYYVQESEVV